MRQPCAFIGRQPCRIGRPFGEPAKDHRREQHRRQALDDEQPLPAVEAVRSIDAQHVPYAEGNGLWRQKGLGAFKAALDRSWKPYLEGQGTLGEALRAVLKG